MNSSKIQRLPDGVISQIAAAQVVQRPAAVVKELIENAIDAHSKEIKLVVQGGGKRLIQVIDDGEGMDEKDAVNCFQRYATSKITSVNDLFAIQTLGFRGEALPSIATISQMELITKTSTAELGTKVIVHGGVFKSQSPVAVQKGTQIAVKNIFFNTPARRNFLKTVPTETKHIIEEFQRAAINYPRIAFSYSQNNEQLYKLPSSKSIQRIVHLFGDSYQKYLIPCEETTENVTLSGYIGVPSYGKKTRGEQFFFVNNRYVKSTLVQYAIKRAFQGLALPDTFPFYALHLTVPPQTIDIHIHPMKTDVKFEDENLIYMIVSSAIKKSLAVHHVIPSIDFNTNVNQNFLTSGSYSSRHTHASPGREQEEEYTQFKNRIHGTHTSDTMPFTQKEKSTVRIKSMANDEANDFNTDGGILSGEKEKHFLSLHHSYILTSVKSGVLVIDVKAAYERIFYERYSAYLHHRSDSVQKLLFPVETRVTHADFTLLQACRHYIEKLGFCMEMRPPDTVLFTAQPPEAQGKDLQNLLEELLEQYKTTCTLNESREGETWAKTLAKRMASHKKGKKTEKNEVNALINQLFASKNANYTPEGKPIWSIISMESLAKLLLEREQSRSSHRTL